MAHQLLRRPGLCCRGPVAMPLRAHVTTRSVFNELSTTVSPALSLRCHQFFTVAPSQFARLAPCRAAAENEVADPMERPRARFLLDTSPEIIDGPDAPELPMPSEFQQTLYTSFTLAGIGLHTGEYACVRVRPAFAGEGRYFVRVPPGTNAARADADADMDLQQELADDINTEEALLNDPEYKAELVARYQEYIDAQEEEGFGGSFGDYLQANDYTELVQRLEEEGPPKFSFSQAEEPQPRSEDELHLPASAAHICEPNPVTTTLTRGDFQVGGVEGLLSALEACGVDNARIEIEGGSELPVLDGSAEGWTDEICRAGLRYAPQRPDLAVKLPPGALDPPEAAGGAAGEEENEEVEEDEEEEDEAGQRQGSGGAATATVTAPAGKPVPKLVLRPQSVISVVRGSSFVTLYPEDTFRLTAGLDRHREAPVIGKQWMSWCMMEDVHYKHSLSDARGFVCSPEQAMGLREAGWLMGGTEGVMLIGLQDRWYDPELVRHEDEPVRRQIQDLIGDLALLAREGHSGLPCGHIVSYDSDHELNAAFVQKLLESTSAEDWVPLRNVAGPSVAVDMAEVLGNVIDEEGAEGEEGEVAYGGGDEEEKLYGDEEEAGEYGEEEEYEEGDGGEYEEGEDEEGVVDVEATEVDPRRGPGGGVGRR